MVNKRPKIALVICVMVVLLVAISGCAVWQPNEQVASLGNTSAPQSGAMVVTANKEATPDIPNTTPKAGYTFVTFNCSVKNVNAKDGYVLLDAWILRDTAGGNYSFSPATYSSGISGFKTQSNTQPGDIVKGLVIFEVPQNATLKSLTYDTIYAKVTFPL